MSGQRRNTDAQKRVGQSLSGGKYVIESVLGQGGMGTLYRARHTVLDRPVAIKLLHMELTEDPTAEARFLIEAKAASRLDHPNSIQILDFGSEDGNCYIVMELLEGRDLATVLAQEGVLSPGRAVSIMSQVLAAVGAAHEVGIVHRDLKPENIMVLHQRDVDDAQERVKVLDFGIAKIGSSDGSVSRALTAVGEICGTPEYMSPEQARGLPLDPRSDLYSCGVVLFRILTLQLPFLGEHPVGTLMQHITEPAPRPSSLRPELPLALEEAILKALAKSPDERFADARAMRIALLQAVGEERSPSLFPPGHVALAQTLNSASPSLAQIEQAPTVALSQSQPSSWGRVLVLTIVIGALSAAAAVLWLKKPAVWNERAADSQETTTLETLETGRQEPVENLVNPGHTDLATTDRESTDTASTEETEPSDETESSEPDTTVQKKKRVKRSRHKSKSRKEKDTAEAIEPPTSTEPELEPDKASEKPAPAPSEKPAPAPSEKPVPAPSEKPVPAPSEKPVPAPSEKEFVEEPVLK